MRNCLFVFLLLFNSKRLNDCVIQIRKVLSDRGLNILLYVILMVLGFLIVLHENWEEWTAHATIAKESYAMGFYNSFNEYKKDRHRYTIPNEVIDQLSRKLYNNEQNDFILGDYQFTEIEINKMGYDGNYYETDDTLFIPCDNVCLVAPKHFQPIKHYEPPVVEKTAEFEVIPDRKDNQFLCEQCGLHFPSERQLQRHGRQHRREINVEEKKSYVLKVADGDMELGKKEYEAVTHFLKGTEFMHKKTVELYIPSLVKMWDKK